MKIRSAELRDARAIAEVHVASWQAAYRGILPEEVLSKLSVAGRAREWEAGLGKAEVARRIVICEFEERVVGFASHGPARDSDVDAARVVELYTIYVLEAAWGRGCGRALWLETLARVKNGSGVEAIVVWVLTDNARGRRFYERAGFAADGAAKEITLVGVTRGEMRYRRAVD